jgi:hypothetical protein
MSRIHWFVREYNTSRITHISRKELDHSGQTLNSVKRGEPFKNIHKPYKDEPYQNIPKPYKDKQGRSNQSRNSIGEFQ